MWGICHLPADTFITNTKSIDTKKPRSLSNKEHEQGFLIMVPQDGLEPSLLSKPDFESGVSTNSTTAAKDCSLFCNLQRSHFSFQKLSSL